MPAEEAHSPTSAPAATTPSRIPFAYGAPDAPVTPRKTLTTGSVTASRRRTGGVRVVRQRPGYPPSALSPPRDASRNVARFVRFSSPR